MIAVQSTVGTSPAHGWWIRDCLRAVSAPARSPVREENVQWGCRIDASRCICTGRYSIVEPWVLWLVRWLGWDKERTVQNSAPFSSIRLCKIWFWTSQRYCPLAIYFLCCDNIALPQQRHTAYRYLMLHLVLHAHIIVNIIVIINMQSPAFSSDIPKTASAP